jgi:hypothetical protein
MTFSDVAAAIMASVVVVAHLNISCIGNYIGVVDEL